MSTNQLTQHAQLSHTEKHIHIALDKPHQILSSAVLNGGLTHAEHLLNIRVPKTSSCTNSADKSLLQYANNLTIKGTVVGMMTAAEMKSLRLEKETVQDIEIAVLVTSGLSNPRHVGDHAEHREMITNKTDVGTINTIVLTSASLSQAALVEAMMIATEAKTAALVDANILSPISQKIATGTGTDAIAIVNGHGATVQFCGKHVLFGEVLGRLVKTAVSSSIYKNSNSNGMKIAK